MSPKQAFRALSIAEAGTWTLLIAGMLAKYGAGADWAVSAAGPVHGFVFLAYVVAAVGVAVNQRWRIGATALAVGAAVIPFATIPVEIAFVRRGMLDGGWRRTRTADPRDARFPSRVLRLVLGRPVLAGAVLIAAVALVFTGLLIAGPPVPSAG
ncbi:DUF3817 domain-containing protein [Microbacteriaceae bacterium VKM Ac-2854]|nr:DUF3817 domain-containing protein [Microbacteriaceae bacterium VKM Ac-2854]